MADKSATRSGIFRWDVLIGIGVVLLLAALVLPALQAARESARSMSCGNNLKQVGLGLHNYHDYHQTLPAGWLSAHPADPSGAESWAWGVPILPYTM